MLTFRGVVKDKKKAHLKEKFPDNYTRIQDAIDASSDNDIIYVQLVNQHIYEFQILKTEKKSETDFTTNFVFVCFRRVSTEC